MSGQDMYASPAQKKINLKVLISRVGFLLLETLFAVLILTTGLTLVVRSFGTSLNALRISNDYTRAMLLMEEKMWDLESKGSINPGTSSGEFSSDNGQFQWTVSATVLGEHNLCEVKVTVFWKKKGKQRDLSVVTYLKRSVGT